MSDEKTRKQTSGLAADSTVAQIGCKEPDKQEWDQETEEKGYRSTSKYLYELVQEARAYRQQGYLAHHRSEEKIAELKARIKDLETQLEREQNRESNTTELADIGFLEKILRQTTRHFQKSWERLSKAASWIISYENRLRMNAPTWLPTIGYSTSGARAGGLRWR